MPGARRTHGLACRKRKRTQVNTGTPKSLGTPCAMVLRLLRALAGVPGLLASVACRSLDKLDPSIGGPRPRDLTVRIGYASSAHRKHPSHPAPRVVTIVRYVPRVGAR